MRDEIPPPLCQASVRLIELALRGRLPSVHGFREEVDAVGFMSYGPNFAAQFRQAATYVDNPAGC